MQEFFIDYGLWLLIALLVIIVIVFLLSGSRKRRTGGLPTLPDMLVEAPVEAAPVAPKPLMPDVATVVPIAVVPVVSAAAVPVPVIPISLTVAAPADGPDDLLLLKGVGPKLRLLLIELGVTSFAQIAGWTDVDIATIDAKLGNFKGRPVRDQWIDQAKYLAAGDVAGFEAKYGKL